MSRVLTPVVLRVAPDRLSRFRTRLPILPVKVLTWGCLLVESPFTLLRIPDSRFPPFRQFICSRLRLLRAVVLVTVVRVVVPRVTKLALRSAGVTATSAWAWGHSVKTVRSRSPHGAPGKRTNTSASNDDGTPVSGACIPVIISVVVGYWAMAARFDCE